MPAEKILMTENMKSVEMMPAVTEASFMKHEIIARLPRDPVNRSDKNLTYVMERELLDACNAKDFRHTTFRIEVGKKAAAYVVFTPEEMMLAMVETAN